MVPQQTRPATITRHTAPVRLRLNTVQTEPNGGTLIHAHKNAHIIIKNHFFSNSFVYLFSCQSFQPPFKRLSMCREC